MRRKADDRQFSFDFGDGLGGLPPPSRDSVFFATLPDPPVAGRIAEGALALQRRLGLPGRLRPRATLHATLLGLGQRNALPDAVIDRARRAAATVRIPRFRVGFDRITTFERKENYPIVLCGDDAEVTGLCALHDALHAALDGQGLKLPAHPIRPHVTVLYGPRAVEDIVLDQPFGWTVKHFVLVLSRHGESRYDILGDWPLLAPVGRSCLGRS